MTVDLRGLAPALVQTCAHWRELDPVADQALGVDGQVPAVWCEPDTVDELAAVMRLAAEHGASVIPRGGGTRLGLGNRPRAADILLSTAGLTRIVEYEPADLTITLEAGLTLAELQARLRPNRQFLALDPACADRATVGGCVASNACGPLRLRYGSARDLVIGTRVVNADGRVTKAGGRVVKNVAGYDLNKLYTGSLGTVGLIVELSFKLHPLPRQLGTVLAGFGDLAAAGEVIQRLMRSALNPLAVELFDDQASRLLAGGPAVSESGCGLAVLVGGFEAAVERVCGEIAGFCREGGRADILPDDPASQQLWERIRALTDASEPAAPLLRLALPPSRSIEGLAELRRLAAAAELSPCLCAHAGVGLVYARIPAQSWNEPAVDRLTGLVSAARAFAAQQGGSLVVESGPPSLKERIDAWGQVGPALGLMRRIKDQLDPEGRLNPGRFVGGI
jgi:glycolate oxidase FAD binding subunit